VSVELDTTSGGILAYRPEDSYFVSSALSTSTTKKVYVRRFDAVTVHGYASPQTYLRPDGVEVLDRSAQVVLIPYAEIKGVYFVREFERNAEAKQKTVFATRPKQNGLWVRFTFRDGEILEGILPNNLLLLEEKGVTATPPDPNANARRVFVPREAVRELTVLGVIGSPVRRLKRKAKEITEDQMDLFGGGTAARPAG
jgi:hypothetical protein